MHHCSDYAERAKGVCDEGADILVGQDGHVKGFVEGFAAEKKIPHFAGVRS